MNITSNKQELTEVNIEKNGITISLTAQEAKELYNKLHCMLELNSGNNSPFNVYPKQYWSGLGAGNPTPMLPHNPQFHPNEPQFITGMSRVN